MLHNVVDSLILLHDAMMNKDQNMIESVLNQQLIVKQALCFDFSEFLDAHITNVTLREYLDFDDSSYTCLDIKHLITEINALIEENDREDRDSYESQ